MNSTSTTGGVAASPAKEAVQEAPAYTGVEIAVKLLFFLTLVGWTIVLIVEPEHVESKWGLWGLTALVVVLENNWVLRKSLIARHLRTNHDVDARTRGLQKTKVLLHFERRPVMVDIVDTFLEKLRSGLHDNTTKLYLEGNIKTYFGDKTGDTIGALESKIDWGKKWMPVGREMQGMTVSFGEAMRRLYFDVEPGYLDCATTGIVPKPVLEGRRQWDAANQENPVVWRFKSLMFRMSQGRSRIASEIGADPDDTVFVASGHEGVATVVRGLPWQTGDRFMHICAEGDTQFEGMAEWAHGQFGLDVIACTLPLPCSDVEILEAVRKVLAAHTGVVFCLFPHVMRNGWLLPAQALTSLLHDHSVSVMIEGSLAMGQHQFDVSQIRADWYSAALSNFIPGLPGCGFLVTSPLKQAVTTPLTVSYFDLKGYEKEFSYYGLRDFSSWLSVIDAFDFLDQVCGEMKEVRRHGRTITHKGEQVIRRKWGESFVPVQGRRPGKGDTVVLATGHPGDACIRFQSEKAKIVEDRYGHECYQVQGVRSAKLWYKRGHLRLPDQSYSSDYGLMPTFRIPNSKNLGDEAAEKLRHELHSRGITVHVFSARLTEQQRYLYARCSAGPHTSVDDFVRFADAVLDMRGVYP